jgi:hypothetical protein
MSEADDPKRNEEAEGGPSSPRAASSRDEPPDEPISSEGADMIDEVDLREMMRQALERPPQGDPPDILKGVQRRIRTRSRGKFYGDGWSTARAPRSTYLMTSLLMLILIAFVFLVLIPWGGGALPLP